MIGIGLSPTLGPFRAASGGSTLLSALAHRWGLEVDGSWPDTIGGDDFAESATVTVGAGKLGNAAHIDAFSSLAASASADYNLGAPKTIALWFYVPAGTGALVLTRGGFGATREFFLFHNGAGGAALSVYDEAGTEQALPGMSPANDSWHSIIIQSNGVDRARYRLNGGAWQTKIVPGFRANTAEPLTSEGVCRVDEITVWNRELTDDECAEWENGGAGISYPYG